VPNGPFRVTIPVRQTIASPTKGIIVTFPALTQFFNDLTIFGGDLLSLSFTFGFGK
jgi:hypothetical protein